MAQTSVPTDPIGCPRSADAGSLCQPRHVGWRATVTTPVPAEGRAFRSVYARSVNSQYDEELFIRDFFNGQAPRFLRRRGRERLPEVQQHLLSRDARWMVGHRHRCPFRVRERYARHRPDTRFFSFFVAGRVRQQARFWVAGGDHLLSSAEHDAAGAGRHSPGGADHHARRPALARRRAEGGLPEHGHRAGRAEERSPVSTSAVPAGPRVHRGPSARPAGDPRLLREEWLCRRGTVPQGRRAKPVLHAARAMRLARSTFAGLSQLLLSSKWSGSGRTVVVAPAQRDATRHTTTLGSDVARSSSRRGVFQCPATAVFP